MNERVRRVREDQGGFTLIELMIVIIILGILAGVVIFSVNGITNRGEVAACKTDLRSIETAVEAYSAQNSGGLAPDLVPSLTDPAGGNQFLRWDSGFTGTTAGDDAVNTGNVHAGDGFTITYYTTGGDSQGAGTVDATHPEGTVEATGC
jgi:prepilin-type N-terminal cleavage/methylation domain-containing protein